MREKGRKLRSGLLNRLVSIGLHVPWAEILTDLWRGGKRLVKGFAREGLYEVVEHESTLELKDKQGKEATFKKRQRVRYRQNNIIAYQDQAWGDGEILVNYQCSPGIPVDFYRPASKTYVLISLREVKNKGDEDEFNMEWDIKNGFLRQTEQWDTEISHQTKEAKLQVIFPKNRPPRRTAIIKKIRQKTTPVGDRAKRKLPDGRWLVSWETNKPRLHERYSLKWEW